MIRPAAQIPDGHPPACMCPACLAADMDAHLIAQGREPLGLADGLFYRVPRAYRESVEQGGRVAVVLPVELEDASPAELVDAGAADPVLVHVEDVAAGMYLRVEGLDPAGSWVTVTGFIGWPSDVPGGVVAVPVSAEPGTPPGVVLLVDPDARLELRQAPWDLAARAALVVDLGQLDRVDLVNCVGEVTRSIPVATAAEVDAIARDHHPDDIDPDGALALALFTLNWRGQR